MSGNNGRGRHWIRDEKRLAIYLRDGIACIYCGAKLEDGIILTLDHLQSRKFKGTNEPHNLITCCQSCNSSRQTTPIQKWVLRFGKKANKIMKTIEQKINTPIDVAETKKIMARRGFSFSTL
jgi:5-methylcytosine-specific restriction endonuclease McrA